MLAATKSMGSVVKKVPTTSDVPNGDRSRHSEHPRHRRPSRERNIADSRSYIAMSPRRSKERSSESSGSSSRHHERRPSGKRMPSSSFGSNLPASYRESFSGHPSSSHHNSSNNFRGRQPLQFRRGRLISGRGGGGGGRGHFSRKRPMSPARQPRPPKRSKGNKRGRGSFAIGYGRPVNHPPAYDVSPDRVQRDQTPPVALNHAELMAKMREAKASDNIDEYHRYRDMLNDLVRQKKEYSRRQARGEKPVDIAELDLEEVDCLETQEDEGDSRQQNEQFVRSNGQTDGEKERANSFTPENRINKINHTNGQKSGTGPRTPPDKMSSTGMGKGHRHESHTPSSDSSSTSSFSDEEEDEEEAAFFQFSDDVDLDAMVRAATNSGHGTEESNNEPQQNPADVEDVPNYGNQEDFDLKECEEERAEGVDCDSDEEPHSDDAEDQEEANRLLEALQSASAEAKRVAAGIPDKELVKIMQIARALKLPEPSTSAARPGKATIGSLAQPGPSSAPHLKPAESARKEESIQQKRIISLTKNTVTNTELPATNPQQQQQATTVASRIISLKSITSAVPAAGSSGNLVNDPFKRKEITAPKEYPKPIKTAKPKPNAPPTHVPAGKKKFNPKNQKNTKFFKKPRFH